MNICESPNARNDPVQSKTVLKQTLVLLETTWFQSSGYLLHIGISVLHLLFFENLSLYSIHTVYMSMFVIAAVKWAIGK